MFVVMCFGRLTVDSCLELAAESTPVETVSLDVVKDLGLLLDGCKVVCRRSCRHNATGRVSGTVEAFLLLNVFIVVKLLLLGVWDGVGRSLSSARGGRQL